MATATSTPRVQQAINGDVPLTARERIEYMHSNAARNAANAHASLIEGVVSRPGPGLVPIAEQGFSPSRADVHAFFSWAAERLAPRFAGREVVILDLGCGHAPIAPYFARAGFAGEYVGIDISRHRAWEDGPLGRLRRRLVCEDIAKVNAAELPRADIVVSATALEHIRDDGGAVRKLESRLAPGGCQAHFVPAEAALPLYGPHGWRQYSPRCLRELFPAGTIYRYGGPAGSRVHERVITRRLELGKPDGRTVHPRLYALARERARLRDGATGNTSPTMYAVLVE